MRSRRNCSIGSYGCYRARPAASSEQEEIKGSTDAQLFGFQPLTRSFQPLQELSRKPRPSDDAMDALSQPPASLEALRRRKSSLDSDLALHDDLAARLDGLLAARAQGNGRMDLPVDIGMGFTVEGVV